TNSGTADAIAANMEVVSAGLEVGSHPPLELSPVLIAESWRWVPGVSKPPTPSSPDQSNPNRMRRATTIKGNEWLSAAGRYSPPPPPHCARPYAPTDSYVRLK